MPGIGVAGAGVAGLPLGPLLRQHGIPVTLYCDRDPLQAAGCGLRAAGCGLRAAGCGLRAAGCGLRAAGCDVSLPATVAHHAPTPARERRLGVSFRPAEE
ncbi:hypothetical protein [Streptomyces sp. NPDC059786]|uniref:hypothetical protein n=1 Tax=Streptomyces sp. NPDC059786 TaxID=3346946 RepID=UPI00365D0AB4